MATPVNRTTNASTMMSAAARFREETALCNRFILQGLEIEVAIIDSNALRRFLRNQLAGTGLASLRDRLHNAFPLRFQITNSLPSNTSAVGVLKVGHVKGNV